MKKELEPFKLMNDIRGIISTEIKSYAKKVEQNPNCPESEYRLWNSYIDYISVNAADEIMKRLEEK